MTTAATVKELMGETTGQVYVELITFEATGEPPGYLAINNEDIVSRGKTYKAADIAFVPAKDTGDELSKASLVFSNVSRDLIDEIRQAHENPTITAELIAASRPDTVERHIGPLEVQSVTFTTNSIKAELGQNQNIFDEQYPYGSYIPSTFPGVFA